MVHTTPMKKATFLVLLLAVLGSAYAYRGSLQDAWWQWNRPTVPLAERLEDIRARNGEIPIVPTRKTESGAMLEEIPEEFNLEMQFYPQAPFADWGMPYQEACEEASVLIAMNYVRGEKMSRKAFDQALLKIVDFEMDHFGYFEHTTVKETADIVREYYDYDKVRIIENPTIEQIKREIAAGNAVVPPLAGQLIGNPFYTPPGPPYHMLVIKGYTDKHFITHDVGTKRGADFVYPFKTIMDSIHDYAVPITNGEKRILVIEI